MKKGGATGCSEQKIERSGEGALVICSGVQVPPWCLMQRVPGPLPRAGGNDLEHLVDQIQLDSGLVAVELPAKPLL